VKYCISIAFYLSSHTHITRNKIDSKKYEQTWITVFLKNTSDSRKSFVLVSIESSLKKFLILAVGYKAETRYTHTKIRTLKKFMKSIIIIISKKSILS